MNNSQLETLNVTQQVLRGITVSLAAACKADLGDLGAALEAFASSHALEPEARQMLLDLAVGATALYAAGIRKS
jgi:hypothetical protein